ncbi:hypothetical protein DL96DRAFT_1715130 [Flagelloscypha sp. PMI_526]|nr:hypothetical protein DL96DRAFT_1715130 [Flagelloscypha sp. PMI_526]
MPSEPTSSLMAYFISLSLLDWPTKVFDFATTCNRQITKEEVESGPKDAIIHTVTYYMDGVEYGQASASTLKKARKAAAEKAYHALEAEIKGE